MKPFLFVLLAVVLPATLRAAERPNVLFILCDDIRPYAISCYGAKDIHTPQIDRLASEGVRFANMFCTTSLCSPSRASFLTGLYAHHHGVRNNFTELDPALPQWPALLRQSGYTTAYIGKWHMGEDNDEPRPGFDWFVTHKGQGTYYDTAFNINGEGTKVIPGYYTTIVTDMALDWLKKQSRDKPWSLCLGHKAPHSFYTPEPKYANVFDNIRVPYPDSAFHLEDKPEWVKQRLTTWHGIYGPLFEWRKKYPDSTPEGVQDFERMVHGYWGTILSVEDSLARLREFLETTGQLDNTIIVFAGDNGLLEGEHGMVDKRTMHEPSIRIPMIVRYPPLGQGKVETHQVLTLDLASSLLELCGAPPIAKSDGRSWVPLVRAGADPGWRTAWCYEYNYEQQFPYTPNIRGLRTDRWKYMHYPHGPRIDSQPDGYIAELYDLQNDPDELRNLISDPTQATNLESLQRQLVESFRASGLAPEDDVMPIDQGVQQALPAQKIR